MNRHARRDSRGRRAIGALLAMSLAMAAPAAASQLQLPHIAGRDGGLSGNVVASPKGIGGILFFNSAGIADTHGTRVTASTQVFNISGRYTNDAIGYDNKSSENPISPALLVTNDLGDWKIGAGLYGAIGTAYNFPADDQAGVTSRFLGELATIHFGLLAGREILPGLRFGAQVAPSFGSLRSRTPSPLGNVSFDLDGFGVVGSVGLLWDATDATSVGLSYRTPGVIFMSGDGSVGDAPEDVEIDFRLPQNVTFGFAHRLTDRVLVTAQANWADYRQFEDGEFEFDRNPALNQPFIADARSVFRWGAGVELDVTRRIQARTGFSYEPWLIEESALRPSLYDGNDIMWMLGLGFRDGPWRVDFQTGILKIDDRVATSEENPFFPGRYQLESVSAFGLAVVYQFDAGA